MTHPGLFNLCSARPACRPEGRWWNHAAPLRRPTRPEPPRADLLTTSCRLDGDDRAVLRPPLRLPYCFHRIAKTALGDALLLGHLSHLEGYDTRCRSQGRVGGKQRRSRRGQVGLGRDGLGRGEDHLVGYLGRPADDGAQAETWGQGGVVGLPDLEGEPALLDIIGR